ncbi:hypothetical protein [Nostoc sp.]|uniref:hypothetical protein n=1 Tax=Nostoc sp. TaxID=1180 RepID=UPI002FF51BCA
MTSSDIHVYPSRWTTSGTGRRLASDVLPDISVSQNLLKLTMLANAPSAFKARNA